MKKITSMLIIISLLFSLCTIVNAASTEATISEGSINGNKVTFTITLPEKIGLRGDANNDGEFNTLDVNLLNEYDLGSITLEDLNEFNADYNCDGYVGIADSKAVSKAIMIYRPITLTGTLAKNSTYEFKRSNATSYIVTVTIPEKTDGTIGVTLNEGIFKYSPSNIENINKAVSSKEMEVKVTTNGGDNTGTEQDKDNQSVSQDTTITISEGKQDKNKITFAITLPKGIGLREDVNNDGKITLNGTLAGESTYQLVQGTDGNYSVVVTVPTNKEGTIGVTLNQGVVIFANNKTNDSIKSKEFKVTLESLKGATEGTNTNDSNNSKNDETSKKDASSSYTKLPAAGSETIIISVIVVIAIIAVIGYIKYKRIDK